VATKTPHIHRPISILRYHNTIYIIIINKTSAML